MSGGQPTRIFFLWHTCRVVLEVASDATERRMEGVWHVKALSISYWGVWSDECLVWLS